MQPRFLLLVILAALGMSLACGSHQSEEERHRQANTPAGKVGQAAHKVAVEAGKASEKIGRQLGKAARDAQAGWKEAARKDQEKKKK